MTGHGGRREGAGRKRRPNSRQMIVIRATDEELSEIQNLDTRERARVLLEAAQTQGEKKMAKYEKLVEEYASDIEEIKALRAVVDSAFAAIRKAETEPGYDYGEQHREMDALYQAWERAKYDLDAAQDKLTQAIEHEYWDVPLAEARKKGVQGFWRASGLVA